ncbi:nicotinic acid mononucleotide adenylyltransferase [Flavobacterium branchiophilum NBRC 15030 = ATCC 35035]|uniref:Probable nicotinate-nucleotide adenylyltransferase n=1 Tax=Flavobacterium branchiophilum TaxID=55197 RepID=A0A543G3P5_9FLAO|nr:nicotinate (nicotinamide) nucleotide adenylyltransferase [Flavobacterium branchiophilum]OXA77630.1 nicotinic acid mononucleotide adenylyltransferase [Flavobacterium branchiophilum NBRC 15030 = ATCC 35035]TQM40685.1 nicotinate-nucleotide adenylyltransferase [Flavobacterium branchiophilum]GEM54236.1 putative nicotinate-nucleotide adenylyltransferase [Flavobacterium branchiophilum NBRC 15030 = ATCC 35035]
MKIGLYFGSFNPIHIGHLIIANHLAEHSDLEQIWLVVTPHNPLKKKQTLLDNYSRLEMVRIATINYPKLRPSDIEFKLSQPNYTVNTLAHLADKYPQHEFALIMGEDNLDSLHKWKNYEFIVKNYTIYVYPRVGSAIENSTIPLTNVVKIAAPKVEISSTWIRNNIQKGLNVQPLLSEKVWKYIDHNNFYKK